MSFFKDLLQALGSASDSGTSSSPPPSSSYSSTDLNSAVMDGVATGNERTAYKLKGYFDLAKEEISKGVRAEEWGLAEDAISHYQIAQRVFAEGMSTPVPSYISSSEMEKVKSYRQKITQWEGQVSDRLQTLSRRTGGSRTSTIKNVTPKVESPISATASSRKASRQKPLRPGIDGSGMRSRTSNGVSSEPAPNTNSGYDSNLVENINSVIVDRSPSVKWDDIAGLEKAKQALLEMVILPTKRKDLFTGLRKPARGLLLFGPPGTGKTMLAKAVASESQVGEGEKLVRTLFSVAISRQPSVIFMDEIDSIMSSRKTDENEASRRLKSEFLVQFDGVASNPNDLGATNKPQELDDAVLRRLVKRIYIPLPDANVRRQLLKHKLKGKSFSLPDGDIERIVKETDGYSGSDLQALCEEAAMMPIRELGANILTVSANQVRRLEYEDFRKSMAVVRPSLQKRKWEELNQWNQEFGSN